jgi:hypothetical protein
MIFGLLGLAILNSTSKNALSLLLCICPFFNKISDKGRTDLPETAEVMGGKVGEGSRVEK